jgi:hypothetical protein
MASVTFDVEGKADRISIHALSPSRCATARGIFDDIRHPDRPHFDTNHHLTIVWEKENPQAAVEGLKATIRATLDDAEQEDGAASD